MKVVPEFYTSLNRPFEPKTSTDGQKKYRGRDEPRRKRNRKTRGYRVGSSAVKGGKNGERLKFQRFHDVEAGADLLGLGVEVYGLRHQQQVGVAAPPAAVAVGVDKHA